MCSSGLRICNRCAATWTRRNGCTAGCSRAIPIAPSRQRILVCSRRDMGSSRQRWISGARRSTRTRTSPRWASTWREGSATPATATRRGAWRNGRFVTIRIPLRPGSSSPSLRPTAASASANAARSRRRANRARSASPFNQAIGEAGRIQGWALTSCALASTDSAFGAGSAAREEVALRAVGSRAGASCASCSRGLDAFGDHVHAQALGEGRRWRGRSPAPPRSPGGSRRSGRSSAVDREAVQVAQRRVAGAEVVDAQLDAERLAAAASSLARPAASLDERALGDLELQAARRQARSRRGSRRRCSTRSACGNCSRREVDAHASAGRARRMRRCHAAIWRQASRSTHRRSGRSARSPRRPG